MAKIVGTEQTIELMVNCKTYPAVSTKYTETVCTGGVQRCGGFVRLYPISFRFLDDEEQYGRWDIIRVRAYRDDRDSRPESWHLTPGTKIEKVERITTDRRRWEWMQGVVYASSATMAERGITNGLVEVEPLEFYWKPDKQEWTEGQLKVILQRDLFASKEKMNALADRVPWQFRLRYREKATGLESDGKVLAWSLYQGYRRRFAQMRDEAAALHETADFVKRSIFDAQRTVFAILGTHSRFGHWMISALWHLPTAVILGDTCKAGRLF